MIQRSKAILVLLLLLSVLVMVSPGAAHPPSSIDLRYEPAGRLLVVAFKHLVQDGQSHYIKEVQVQINGKAFARVELYAQAGKEAGQVSMALSDVKQGDLVSVKATCNKFGEMKKDLRIP
jgi:hypothetical protein